MSVIEVSNLSKKYRIFYEKSSFVKTFFAWTKGQRIYEDLWALKDISFAIEKGETVGVIGKNGSGKTTLLKLLAGVTRQELGQMRIKGFASALLELGTGFQEELTGRENIFLNGAILGMKRKEIREKFDSIVDFAGIGKFIDSPMRTYSTGMWMRLGFSLAINANFEVLLIDEILGVGDMSFQKKCFEKFNQLKQKGITILFVSHNLEKVKEVCNRAIWLEQGSLKAFDVTDEVVNMYVDKVESDDKKMIDLKEKEGTEINALKKKWGSKEAEILKVYFTDKDGNAREDFNTGGVFTVNIRYFAKNIINRPTFGFAIYGIKGEHICGPNTKAYEFLIDSIEGEGEVSFVSESIELLEGEYLISASIYDDDIQKPYDHHEKIYRFSINPNRKEERYGFLKPEGRWYHEKR